MTIFNTPPPIQFNSVHIVMNHKLGLCCFVYGRALAFAASHQSNTTGGGGDDDGIFPNIRNALISS